MTINMDELFEDIYMDEALPLQETMTDEQQQRIESQILSAIRQSSPAAPTPAARKKLHPKRFLVLVLAAALLMGFGVMTSAARYNDWDIALMEFMGLDNADTLQWSDGTVQIDATSLCSGTEYSSDSKGTVQPLRITAVSSIGDKNAAYIRFDTDYLFPEGYNSECDYILPGNMSTNVYAKNPAKDPRITTCGTTFTCMENDGKLSFMLYICGCPKINKSYVQVNFEDLYLYHDGSDETADTSEAPELLYKGAWSLEWKYAYRSNVRISHKMVNLNLNGTSCWLTQIEVSPLGIRLKGFVNPLHRVSEAVWMDIDKITYKDGRVLEVNGGSSSGRTTNGIFLESYCGTDVIGEVLQVDEIESITVGGVTLKL